MHAWIFADVVGDKARPVKLFTIRHLVTDVGKVHNSCHRAPGGSWVAGIPTRWR